MQHGSFKLPSWSSSGSSNRILNWGLVQYVAKNSQEETKRRGLCCHCSQDGLSLDLQRISPWKDYCLGFFQFFPLIIWFMFSQLCWVSIGAMGNQSTRVFPGTNDQQGGADTVNSSRSFIFRKCPWLRLQLLQEDQMPDSISRGNLKANWKWQCHWTVTLSWPAQPLRG